jgi:hypothetical protein
MSHKQRTGAIRGARPLPWYIRARVALYWTPTADG